MGTALHARASQCSGFYCYRTQALGVQASAVVACQPWSTGSVALAHRLSCSAACGIFLGQGLNPCPHLGRQILVHCATREVPASFLIWMPFTPFPCLIALAGASKSMLNPGGKSGCPCLIPDMRGNAFSFSLLSVLQL